MIKRKSIFKQLKQSVLQDTCMNSYCSEQRGDTKLHNGIKDQNCLETVEYNQRLMEPDILNSNLFHSKRKSATNTMKSYYETLMKSSKTTSRNKAKTKESNSKIFHHFPKIKLKKLDLKACSSLNKIISCINGSDSITREKSQTPYKSEIDQANLNNSLTDSVSEISSNHHIANSSMSFHSEKREKDCINGYKLHIKAIPNKFIPRY